MNTPETEKYTSEQNSELLRLAHRFKLSQPHPAPSSIDLCVLFSRPRFIIICSKSLKS